MHWSSTRVELWPNFSHGLSFVLFYMRSHTKNRKSSWYQLCRHGWHPWLSFGGTVTKTLTLWQLSLFTAKSVVFFFSGNWPPLEPPTMPPEENEPHQNGHAHSDDPKPQNGQPPYEELEPMLEDDDASQDEPVDDRQMQCGVGSCRPGWMQPMATIQCFTLTLSLWSLFGSVNFSYYSSVITQIEREFGLPSSFTGFIKNVDNIGYLSTVLIFAHFCRHANKPRLFSAVTVLSSIAIFIFAVPHFIYGMGDRSLDQSSHSNSSWSKQTSSREAEVEWCDGVTEGATELRCGGRAVQSTLNTGAIALFIVSELLQGVAQSPKFALSLTYMDDNAKDESPKYFCKFTNRHPLWPLLLTWFNFNPGMDK